MKKSDHVDQRQDDAEQNQTADFRVGQQQQRDHEDADHGEAQVAPQLEPDDFVGFPSGVDLKFA